jgi:hypothetical protein
MSKFETEGISVDMLNDAPAQLLGGWKVLIRDNRLFYEPFGLEANPDVVQSRSNNPSAYLLMFAQAMCYLRFPDTVFVLNAYDTKMRPDYHSPLPVFSWGRSNDDDYDILFPYYLFLEYNKTLTRINDRMAWDDKVPKAIWRGRTTGGMFTNQTWQAFPRSKLVRLCLNHADVCDAKFVGFPGAYVVSKVLCACLSRTCLPVCLAGAESVSATLVKMNLTAEELPMSEILKYKYAVVPDGNAAPSSRLALHLGLSSVILKQDSPTHEWYYKDLQPYVHYIPVSYYFGDLLKKVRWARRHDALVQQIAKNGNEYAKTHFTEENLACYIHDLVSAYTSLLSFKLSRWPFHGKPLHFPSQFFKSPNDLLQQNADGCKHYNQ